MEVVAVGNRTPEISVVVPSHDRPVRLRWLLNALAEQTLPRERWEVVVAHDSSGADTEELLRTHPLAREGVLRHLTYEPGASPMATRRNAAWRVARSPLVAFTDDDCRPPPEWLERALAAANRHPGAVVQGATRPDPDEWAEGFGPNLHTQNIHPPTPWAETCNIVYPRAVLEATGGFVEEPPLAVADDTDLAVRARKDAGAAYVGAPEVLTYHAAESAPLHRRLRGLWRWQDNPWLVKRHPEMRESYFLWIFWKRSHVWLPFATAGVLLARRKPLWLLLAAPWLAHSLPRYGQAPRTRLRALSEVPGRFLYDATEFAAHARGSLKHRTLFL